MKTCRQVDDKSTPELGERVEPPPPRPRPRCWVGRLVRAPPASKPSTCRKESCNFFAPLRSLRSLSSPFISFHTSSSELTTRVFNLSWTLSSALESICRWLRRERSSDSKRVKACRSTAERSDRQHDKKLERKVILRLPCSKFSTSHHHMASCPALDKLFNLTTSGFCQHLKDVRSPRSHLAPAAQHCQLLWHHFRAAMHLGWMPVSG